jgi:hypothetical protein
LGVGAQDSRGIATGLVTPVLDAQRRSRTEKYQAQSDLFKNSTPAEIEAIRAANRKKNPADRDGDGSWLTSTDNMGRVAGIGSRGDGSGAQPYIFDPTLGKEYQALPQLDPNRGADTNLTTFGKAMRTVGKPVLGALGFGLPILAEKLDQKGFIPDVLKGNTGRGTDIGSLEDLKTTPDAPTTFATSNENAPNPFSETSSASTSGSALSRIQSPYPQKRPTVNAGSPVFDRSETRLKNMGTSDIGALSSPVFRPQLRPDMSGINTSTLTEANKGETIMVDGYPDRYGERVPVSTYFRNDDPDPDLNFPQVMPPSDDEQSIYDRFNYRKYVPINPALIAQSSYGGKFGSGQPNYMASVSPAGIYSDGTAGSAVMTPFFNSTTGQYFEAPSSNFYAEKDSNWRRGIPTEAYNLA